MVAVLGISESSRADLLAELDRLGTNLLRVAPGQSFTGDDADLPETAAAMIRRIDGVEATAATKVIGSATVRRTNLIPEEETGGIAVMAADPTLPATVGATLAKRALPRRRDRPLPGDRARRRRGRAARHRPHRRARLAGRPLVHRGRDPRRRSRSPTRSTPSALSASTSREDAVRRRSLGLDDLRARDTRTRSPGVRDLLGATANPEHPEEVDVSRPSDALEARAAAKTAFTSLFLGLGAVALLVGGVGIANVMVISVLERRSEVGLRRALGRDPAPRRRAVPDRVAAAGGARRARRGRARRRGHRRLRGEPGLAGRRAAGSRSSAAWRRRRRSARSPGSTRRCARPGCRRPRRCGRSSRRPAAAAVVAAAARALDLGGHPAAVLAVGGDLDPALPAFRPEKPLMRSKRVLPLTLMRLVPRSESWMPERLRPRG